MVDEAGLLDRADQARVDQLLREIKARSGVEISVFITPSLEDRAIEEYSLAAAEQWKLGRKKEDKALLFLVAPKERQMRFEVGYGLEGDITDAFSGRVLDGVVKPYFAQGRYADGILAGLGALQEKIPLGLNAGETPPPPARRKKGGGSFLIWILIFLFVVLPFIGRLLGFAPAMRRSHGGFGGWGGGGGFGGGFGGSGGGSWGGGGGGFGGGGASSSW